MAEKDQLEMTKKEEEQAILDERDRAYRADWEALQRRTYPEIYREADLRKAAMAAAEAEAEAEREGRVVGLEPGHDPTLQDAALDDPDLLAATAATAGDDNRLPQEATPQAATSQPPIATGSVEGEAARAAAEEASQTVEDRDREALERAAAEEAKNRDREAKNGNRTPPKKSK